MKDNDHKEIREARANKLHKTMPTDILVIPEVVQQNQQKIMPRRRRRNYEKKIMNDTFIFTV